MTVDEIMRSYASGNDAAFELLYAALSPRIYPFCVRLAGRASDADDLFQETFLKLHRSRASYVPGTQVLHWAFAIARSTYLDRLRRKLRRPETLVGGEDDGSGIDALAGGDGSPESNSHARAMARLVDGELQRMSEANRSAYVLLKIEGLSAAEAGAILGISSDAVKQRAHRAYEALRAALVRGGWTDVCDA